MTLVSSSVSPGSHSSHSPSRSVSDCSPSAWASSATSSVTSSSDRIRDLANDDAAIDPTLRLAGELRGYENLLRATYAAGGRLATAAAEAQASRRLSVICGHQVLAAISAANVEVAEAIAHGAHAHRLLDALARQLGVDTSAYGDEHKYPGNGSGLWLGTDAAAPAEA
jgi:hypothetical protein